MSMNGDLPDEIVPQQFQSVPDRRFNVHRGIGAKCDGCCVVCRSENGKHSDDGSD